MAANATPLGSKSSAVSEDYKSLKDDIATLRDDLKSLASNATDAVREASEDQLRKGKGAAQKAGSKANEYTDVAESKIKEHPIAAIGLAFGLGALVATLRRK